MTSSVVTARTSATDAASRMPVKTYGSAVGQSTCRIRAQALKRKLRAVSSATGSTSATPYRTWTSTCQNAAYTTSSRVEPRSEP
jgi:hypothetical protein